MFMFRIGIVPKSASLKSYRTSNVESHGFIETKIIKYLPTFINKYYVLIPLPPPPNAFMHTNDYSHDFWMPKIMD